MMSIVKDLVFDIGTSEGNDSLFYLQKGFRVVAVEADLTTYGDYCKKLSDWIASGKLIAMHRAATNASGEQIEFFENLQDQGLSSTIQNTKSKYAKTQVSYTVQSVAYRDLAEVYGVPYYCKIDIEGGEVAFLDSFNEANLPEYISVEAHSVAPIEKLIALGYKSFKLVDQRNHQKTTAPNPPLEGIYLPQHKFVHSSGFFGREIQGSRWLDVDEVKKAYDAISYLKSIGRVLNTWYDCHASKLGRSDTD